MKLMENRITSENIERLKENEIFVFGSNLGGRHSKGAAKIAMTWGAIYGRAAGLQGRTYGIPTKDKSIRRVLRIDEIAPFVDDFIEFAKVNPKLTFLVTLIGCGLSNYKPKNIAPLFKGVILLDNVHLPKQFWHKILA